MVLLIVPVFVSVGYAADTHTVCPSGCDYTNIQAAVDAAQPGDTIEVRSGTYDRVNVNKKLTLRGIDTDGGKPVVDAGATGSAITLSHDGIVLDGFTAMNASSPNMAGIEVRSNNNTIINNTASNNYYGIRLTSSSTNTLTGNTALNNSNYGIYLSSSNTNALTENAASNNSYGIYLHSSSTNTLMDNTASNNANYGIYLSSSSTTNTLTGNTASNNSNGIILQFSSTNTLTGNAANSNDQYGIRLHSSSNANKLTANIAANNQYGISLGSSSANILTGNDAKLNSQYGIYLHSSSTKNTLTGNTALSNQYGIYLGSSSANNLTGNIALSNQYGIYLGSSNANNLTGNTAVSNQYGIYLYSSSTNTLIGNTASNNLVGIFLHSSNTNHIYNNYFDNTGNAYDDGTNIWNITKTPGTNIVGGSWLGGNYWSDYRGKDTSGEGLGDTMLPYDSAGNIQHGGDWLPLVAVSFSLDLVAGINLISLPLNDASVTTAAALAAKLGSNCTEVVTFNAAQQQLLSHVPGVPLNNFAIMGGEGYFVNLNYPTSVILTGSGWPSPFHISLVPGLNLISMPVNDSAVTTASTLAAKIGTSCQEVVNWESGTQSYVSYVTGVPLNDFAIHGGKGYFVTVTDQTEVTFEGDLWEN